MAGLPDAAKLLPRERPQGHRPTGTVANGAVATCVGPCFTGSLTGTRPPGHVDASFLETIVPDVLGQ